MRWHETPVVAANVEGLQEHEDRRIERLRRVFVRNHVREGRGVFVALAQHFDGVLRRRCFVMKRIG